METHTLDLDRTEISSPPRSDIQLPERLRDIEADRQIQECLSSKELVNQVISYNYQYSPWKLRLIVNPEKKPMVLKGVSGSGLINFDVAMIAQEELPEPLKTHFLSMFGHLGLKSHLVLNGNCKSDFEMLGQLILAPEPAKKPHSVQPVNIHLPFIRERKQSSPPMFHRPEFIRSFDSSGDQKISQALKSVRFIKTIIPYVFQGEIYELYLIYNPEKLPLKARYRNDTQHICILSSKVPLPQPLNVHLQKLLKSCNIQWDNYENVSFSTGNYRWYDFPTLDALQPFPAYDTLADEKIREVYRSTNFVKTNIRYLYNKITYELLVIHNPEKNSLVDEKNRFIINNSLIVSSKDPLPTDLRSHISTLFQKNEQIAKDLLFELGEWRYYGFALLDSLRLLPLYDVSTDEKIIQTLRSEKSTKLTFSYVSLGKTYEIFLIHNPEKKPLGKDKASSPFNQSLILYSKVALPALVQSHLENLCQICTRNVQDYLIEIGTERLYNFEFLNSLNPISIKDPEKSESLWEMLFFFRKQ